VISVQKIAVAETTVAVELAPRSSSDSALGDLEAPSAPSASSKESNEAVKKLEQMKNEVVKWN
jgi:hypothetical protein